MRTPGRRRRGLRALAAIGLAGALALSAATAASAATWTGTARGKVERSTTLVKGGSTWHGNFWFRTSRTGAARGYAVVAYEPTVDISGLNNAIGYVRDVASSAIGLLGPWSTVAGSAGLGSIVGTNVAFKSPMAVRRGPLTGEVRGGKVRLRWGAKLSRAPYDIELQLAVGHQRIGGGAAPLHDPFTAVGNLVAPGAAVAQQSTPESSNSERQIGSYWVAHRVG